MKKFVIRPYSNPDWLNSYLVGIDLLNLKICNKPLLDFYLDFLYLLKCKEVLIIIPEYQPDILNFVQRESEWGISIRVEIASDEQTYQDIEEKYSTFFDNTDYGVIEKPIFIKYDQRKTDFLTI